MTVQDVVGVPEFTICDRLRKARERTGLGQEQFALELGVSRGTVSSYERDPDAAFKPIVLQAWSMRSAVPLSWLRDGVAPSSPPPGPGQDESQLSRLTERKRARTRGKASGTHRYLAAFVAA